MQVKINGQDRELPDGATLLALIHLHKLTPDKVAVELNRRLVRASGYDAELKPGDVVEIVSFVGGG